VVVTEFGHQHCIPKAPPSRNNDTLIADCGRCRLNDRIFDATSGMTKPGVI
jgi:hypothetical protein